jgi:hypothetical protein
MTDSLDHSLQQLLAEACQAPAHSVARQKVLTRFLALVERSGKLWRGAGIDRDLYAEALNETWLYLLNRIETYDPSRAAVMTWINFHLKNKLKDGQMARQKRAGAQIDWGEPGPSPWDGLPDPASNPWQAVEQAEASEADLMGKIRLWLDGDRSLRRLHLLDRPDINGALLIGDRLPPPKPWKQLGVELNAKPSTLTNFYYNRCLPKLRSFLESQGYGKARD